MALLKAKQLDINSITQSVLNTIQASYDLQFENLVESVKSFSTGYAFPSPVVNAVVTFVDANSATIQWDANLDAMTYTLYLHPQGDPFDYTIIYGISASHIVINNLLPNTRYVYYVSCNLSEYY